MTPPLNLDEIEAKARAATPGPWRNGIGGVAQLSDGGKGYPLDYYPDCADVITTDGADEVVALDRDLDFIASASPDVVLALCARVRELEEGLRGALNMVSDMWRGDPVYMHLRALLAKEVET